MPQFAGEDVAAERDLHVTEDDLQEAKELAATYSLDEVRSVGPHDIHCGSFSDVDQVLTAYLAPDHISSAP